VSETSETQGFLRFSLSDRLEHAAQLATFIPLAVTGLVQRYPGSGLSQWTIEILGGIEAVRIIHRVFAVVLMLAVVYHLGAIGYRRFVLGLPRTMGLGMADMRAAGRAISRNLGLRVAAPQQGRFTFEEKIEYWSLVWGTVLMVVTGFLLWNPIASTKLLPGSSIPAARAAHGAEAVLATLAVIIWHAYHIHIRFFNKSIFTGYLPMERMESEHPLELTADRPERPPADVVRERRRKFIPVYSAGAAVFIFGIWLFVSFEDTAITTIEPIEDPVVFAPITTTTLFTVTTSTLAPTTTTDAAATTSTAAGPIGQDLTWNDFAPTFEEACGSCHVSTQLGGLSLATYGSALTGGNNGPGIEPGDPDASLIVTVIEEGRHPGRLDDDVLAALRAWIVAGAPEG
jgi:cytochrome b subunit of formate dehydrogenase